MQRTQHIWPSISTLGSGWGGLGFGSGSYQRLLMVLTAPQPVLDIMSLSKGNALAIKRWYNSKSWWHGCLLREKGIRLTDHFKSLAFDIS